MTLMIETGVLAEILAETRAIPGSACAVCRRTAMDPRPAVSPDWRRRLAALLRRRSTRAAARLQALQRRRLAPSANSPPRIRRCRPPLRRVQLDRALYRLGARYRRGSPAAGLQAKDFVEPGDWHGGASRARAWTGKSLPVGGADVLGARDRARTPGRRTFAGVGRLVDHRRLHARPKRSARGTQTPHCRSLNGQSFPQNSDGPVGGRGRLLFWP